MELLHLRSDVTELLLSTQGATVLGWTLATPTGPVPLLRPALHDGRGRPGDSSAFPLVPFGNRLGGNRFHVAGRDFDVTPNSGDRYRLHGDGWLSDWTVEAVDSSSARLVLVHKADGHAPWDYVARMDFVLAHRSLRLSLSVENCGEHMLPFGLGWHPYFPLTARTRLTAGAATVWQEGDDHLPTLETPLPADLDFTTARTLPDRWINNGFEGWDGHARIDWPERELSLTLTADPVFSRYVLYRADAARDPSCRGDWFCLEPMTHAINGFHLPGLAGLACLAPGERLEGGLRLEV